jgi:DegV family protein with EDD domain
MTIRVITDSACDLPAAMAHELGVDVVPLSIRFGHEEFTDGELTPTEFWAKCATSSELPETAAPAPGAFQAAYQRARDAGASGVIVIALSADLSATHQSAVLGAQAMEDFPIAIVDSRAVSMAQGLIVIAVARAAQSGATLAALTTLAQDMVQRTGVVGTINTLEHLIKGGRLKGAKALLGSMLSVKPLLRLTDGLVAEAGKERTRSRALAALAKEMAAAGPLESLAIVHGNANDVDQLVALVADTPVRHPLIVADMGSVVGTHGGPGIVALCWVTTAEGQLP